jgi:putative transposase
VAAVLTPPARLRPDLATPAAVEALALRIRKELAEQGWDHGPLSVRARLLQLREQGRDQGLFAPVSTPVSTPASTQAGRQASAGVRVPSRATLARIFTRHGAVTPAPNKRPHASYRRFTFARAHECWQLDATEWHLADGRSVAIFQLEDDHSRYVVGSQVAWSENSAAAVAVLQAAVAAHQAPVLLLTDNGVAMNPHRRGATSQLAAYAAALGTRAITGRVYHPQTTGKNERLHQTLKRWLRARPLPADLDQLGRWLTEFDSHYNQRRPHQALDHRTPAQVLASAAHALPPHPPPPPDPPPTRASSVTSTKRSRTPADRQLRRLRVMTNGSVKVGHRYYIGLGVQHAGSYVLALVDTTTITIFDIHGTELRTVHPHPAQIYYGTGKPRGGPRRPRPAKDSNPNQPSGPN